LTGDFIYDRIRGGITERNDSGSCAGPEDSPQSPKVFAFCRFNGFRFRGVHHPVRLWASLFPMEKLAENGRLHTNIIMPHGLKLGVYSENEGHWDEGIGKPHIGV